MGRHASALTTRDETAARAAVTERVLSGDDALEAIEPVWRQMWAMTDPAPPMLEYDWIREWWRLHRDQGELLIIEASDARDVVGLAPLYIRHRQGSVNGILRSVRFLGEGEREADEIYSTHNGWLGPHEAWPAVTEAVAQVLRRERSRWERLVLRNIGPDTSPATDLARLLEAELAESRLERGESFLARVAPMEQYIDSVPGSKVRCDLRRTCRRCESVGAQFVCAVEVAEVMPMFERLVLMHQQQWHARGLPGACASPVFLDFHRRVIRRYAQDGRVWLAGLRAEGQWLALHYYFRVKDRLYAYLGGMHPEAGRKVYAGKVLDLHVFDRAAREGIEIVDLFGGGKIYKRTLTNEEIELVTLDALAARPVAQAWRGMRELRARLRPRSDR